MEKDKIITEVIFRKFKNGAVFALFPYITERKFGNCLSYQHIGQHSEATLGLICDTKLATETEYLPLLSELRYIGYIPKVIKKMNWNKYRKEYNLNL